MKISYDRPKISSSKINHKKDFNELIHLHKVMKPFYKQSWFIISASLASLALLVFVFTNKPQINSAPTQIIIQKEQDSAKVIKTISSAIKEETPCINQPIKSIEVPFKTFIISTQKKQELSYNGANLSIPKNAFIYSDGTTVKDSITLKLYVYNDPIDFIISGIPMEYDSAGMTYTFESGGMIQLEGYTLDSHSIAINKQTPLEIAFNTSASDPNFNFYHLDTLSKKWNYLTSNTLKEETTVFEQDKTHSFDEPSWKLAYKEQNIANQKWEKAKKEVQKHKKTEPIAPKKLTNKDKSFTLDIDKYEFPELASYQTVQFEPIKSSKNIQHIYNTEWDDIQLRPHNKAMTYELVLKNKNTIEIVIAQPVYSGKSWAKAQHIYGNKYAEYVAILDQKEEKEQLLKEDYEEKKKRFDERDKLKEKAKTIVTAVATTLVAPVVNFGIFNFDRPIINRPKTNTPPSNNFELESVEQPKFSLLNGEDIIFDKIYTIESKRNASFTHDLTKGNFFSYNPKSKISIIGIKNETEIYLVNANNFKEGIQQNNVFSTELIKNTTLNELKRLILKI